MKPPRLVYLNRRHNRQVAQLSEVMREMGRQDDKWGPQNLLDVNPMVESIADPLHRASIARDVYQIPGADRARALVDRAKQAGRNEWAAIALEELCEAIEAKRGRPRRAELVQLTAVCMQWIDDIDRRAGRKGKRHEREAEKESPRPADRIRRRGDDRHVSRERPRRTADRGRKRNR